ncbi:hypothetical protein BH10ACT7_BH10ACT7_19770 [soil metagenome]
MPESRLGQIALTLVVPALLLPVLAASVLMIAQTSSWGVDNGVGGIVVLVYLFVLLGSMTLNAWLLLRHPDTLSRRALPWASSAVLVALWGVLGLWTVLLGLPVPSEISGWLSIVFAILGIVLSIVSFFLAASRRADTGDRTPLTEVPLGTRAQVILWVYLVIAALALLSYVAVTAGGAYGMTGSMVGGAPSWVLIVLGLPWSHPLYFISVVAGVLFSSALGSAAAVSAIVIPVIGVGINIAFACVLLFSPTRRIRLVNWFFRLRSTPTRTPVPVPPQ